MNTFFSEFLIPSNVILMFLPLEEYMRAGLCKVTTRAVDVDTTKQLT